MLDQSVRFLLEHPGLLVLFVFAAAAIEYVFPPFWGDTLMLAGSFVAGLEPATIPAVFAGALAGSCVGAMGAWWIGRRFGQASLGFLLSSKRALKMADRAERLHARHGAVVLAINRFLPGLRAFLLPLAGAGRMPGRRVFVWSTVSNVLYCALLTAVGAVVAARAPDFGSLEAHFQRASLWAASLAVAAVALVASRPLLRHLRSAA